MRKLVLGVIVCILVAIINYPVHFKAYYHSFYTATKGYPWIDPVPMEMTWFWNSAIAIWVIDAGVLTLLIFKGAKKWRWRLLYTSMVIALLYICLFTPILRLAFRALPPPFVFAFEEPIVDVLLMGDEEFMANPEWVSKAESLVKQASSEIYWEFFNICFEIHGWKTWDSNDTEKDPFKLLDEAVRQSGLRIRPAKLGDGLPTIHGVVSGSPYLTSGNYYAYIDLLIAFTGQEMIYENWVVLGLSPPEANATIISYKGLDLKVVVHEIGHQYYLDHCLNMHCVMNLVPEVPWFCYDCSAKLENASNKWRTDPSIIAGLWLVNEDGSINIRANVADVYYYTCGIWVCIKGSDAACPDGARHGFRAPYGASVYVYIRPHPHYVIKEVILRNLPLSYTYPPGEQPTLITKNLGSTRHFSYINNGTWASYIALFEWTEDPPDC